jgi:hypothetical protein
MAKKKKTSPTKPKLATSAKAAAAKVRRLEPPKKARWRLKKNQRPQVAATPNGFRILKGSLGVLKANWRIFGGIILVYMILSVALVGSLGAGGDLAGTKDDLAMSNAGSLDTGFTIFAVLLGSGSSSGEGGSAYQSVVLVVISLATIWALRQVMADKTIRIRDAFYKGMYPLVPFVLVLLVIGLQLIPALVGAFLFTALSGAGILGNPVVGILALVLFCGLVYLSIFYLCASLFALYIVTLPDTTPFQALRAARQLVKYRRFGIIRKLLLLPLLYFFAGALLMVPIALYATFLAPLIFLLLTMLGLIIAHAYLYNLYRELL